MTIHIALGWEPVQSALITTLDGREETYGGCLFA
jgi:hypothetical protein